MRIAVNATILDSRPTGLGVYTLNLIRELSQLIGPDDQLIVFTSYPQGLKGCKIKLRGVSSCLQPQYGVGAGFFRFLWTQFVYPFRISKEKCDAVYSTTHHTVFLLKTPQIITIHDLLPLKFPARYRLQYLYFKYMIPVLLKRCAAVVAVSENTKKDILQYYGIPSEKVTVVYNSYDGNLFLAPSAENSKRKYADDPYILAVGASYVNKNLERLLEAYAQIKDKIPHRLLITGGRKDYIDSLREKAGYLKIAGSVTFMNYVPPEDLPHLYRNAAVFVFPSLDEGFGIPLLEAMACGCPVVASDVSSIPEVCNDAAYYVDPYNADGIARGIIEVLKNEGLRNDLIQKGFKRVKMFSWKNSAQKIFNILKNQDKRRPS